MKNKMFTAAFIALTMIITGCAKQTAEIVIVNGKILTIDNQEPFTGGIAIKDGVIIAVGPDDQIKPYISKETRVIEAGGRLVIPGFNDAHVHFMPVDPDFIELRYVTDPAIIREKVKEQVGRSARGQLISGGHWDHELFAGSQWPTKELIDPVSQDNPVVLERVDGHSILVNSRVLEASGITARTPDPEGGEIVRDPVTGEPTGILKESAMSLVKYGDRKVKRSKEEEAERLHKGYLLALKQAAEYGVTSVQIPGEADFSAYKKLLDESLLTLRIDIGGKLTDNKSLLKKYEEQSKEFPLTGNWLRFGYLKGFMDGTLGSGTAMMYEPFTDDPSTSGLPQMSYEKLEKEVITADAMGFQIGIHAIGPKANTWILNAYQKAVEINGKRDSRHRSEHAQILIEQDIRRFGELGVIPSMQPTHCITDKAFAEKRIGTDRCRFAYAWKSLADNGAHLAFGTDYPVEPLNPMEGLYAAVTRKDRKGEEGQGWFPEQKLSMEKAIEYYTLGSAYAQFMEDRKGMIKKGYLADIIILNADLLTIPENKIMSTKIDFTITGGKVIFERELSEK
ncbi:MAG TPA: amidohydrolase [Bacteroidales bacterium]|nr:amidohydrolase [Bacteroidales bacterium]